MRSVVTRVLPTAWWRCAAVGASLVLAVGAQAQNRSTSAGPTAASDSTTARSASCPGGTGIRISVSSGEGSSEGIGLNELQSVDTTIVFNIIQKTWTRTNLAAAITVGLVDQSRGSYSICAGVSALMPSATLTIRGARGRVHFQGSLADLRNAIRSGSGARPST